MKKIFKKTIPYIFLIALLFVFFMVYMITAKNTVHSSEISVIDSSAVGYSYEPSTTDDYIIEDNTVVESVPETTGPPLYYAEGVSGDCIWMLDFDGELTISGDGAMENYSTYHNTTTAPWRTNIKTVVIEDGVTSIGNNAFCGCKNLTSITIPDSVTSIGYGAFYNCSGLTSVTIPDGVTSIGSSVFYGCTGLTSVTISNSVTSIGESAFEDCSGLSSVTIPNSVTSIGNDAFWGCTGLTSVHISDIAAWCNIAFTAADSNPLLYAHNLYLNDVPVTDLIIPDSVTSIGDYAFRNCTGLKSVTIPDTVTEIGYDAFANGSADLTIYGNIGTAAEYYCKTDGVRFRAIYEYTLLSDDTIRVTKCNLIERQLVIPSTIGGKSVSQIGEWLFLNNSSITSVTLPDSLTRIGKGAFYSCVELKTVTMGNNVTEIGESAFEKCLFLEQINLSSKLKTIGDEAFYDCRRLKQLNLPNTLTTIGEEAFTNCRSLTELVIPKGVQNIGNEESVGFGMFENCKNLKEITIPESVGYIQDNAFDGCGQVTIRAKVNSYAAQYAAANQLAFSKIDSEPVGDANGDSKINVRDVTSIQRFVGEFVQFTDEQLAAADVDGNGIVDINDATYLQMYLAEYDVTLG